MRKPQSRPTRAGLCLLSLFLSSSLFTIHSVDELYLSLCTKHGFATLIPFSHRQIFLSFFFDLPRLGRYETMSETFTTADVAKHKDAENGYWLIVENDVYDVTSETSLPPFPPHFPSAKRGG